MTHDHVLKKLIFDLLTQSLGSEGGGVPSAGNIRMCYHVAACVIPFNLICNVTIF